MHVICDIVIIANRKKNRRVVLLVCGTALLIVAAVVGALRERQAEPPPEVPVAASPAEVRVKAVERNPAAVSRPPRLPRRLIF